MLTVHQSAGGSVGSQNEMLPKNVPNSPANGTPNGSRRRWTGLRTPDHYCTMSKSSDDMQPLVPSQPANEIAEKRDIAISSRHLHRLQRRHFVLFDVLPLIGTMA